MKFAILLLLLAGCCPHEPLRIEGGSPTSVLVYDPDTNILWDFWFEDGIWKKRPHENWNHGR